MENKKILMVLYDRLERGGVQNVIMQIVRTLSNRYIFDIVVFDSAPSYYDSEFESFGGRIFRFGRYDQHSTFHARGDYYLRIGYVYRNVLGILRKEGPYVAIHCHNCLESGLCTLAGKRVGIPVRIAHTHTSYENQGNIVYRTYNRFYQHLIRKYATHKVGCSAMALEKTFGDSTGIVIGNGVDLNLFANENRCMFTEKTDHSIKLLQVATFSPNKNQIFSLQILKELVSRGTKATLTLLGRCSTSEKTGYYATIQEFIKNSGLGEYVQFVPGDSSVPDEMKRNTFLLFPSLREGFGIVPIEAQASGLHCFVSSTVPRDIDCGGCTFLSLEDGPELWADNIIQKFKETNGVLGNYDCSRFSNQKISMQYQKIYEGMS